MAFSRCYFQPAPMLAAAHSAKNSFPLCRIRQINTTAAKNPLLFIHHKPRLPNQGTHLLSKDVAVHKEVQVVSDPVSAETHIQPGTPMWDDSLFLPVPDNQLQEIYGETVETMKEQVRKMVVDTGTNPKDKMILIDTIERLGVGYHFQDEIEVLVEQFFKSAIENNHEDDDHDDHDHDLSMTAIHFRLFRQHGFNAPSSVFNKFKDPVTNSFKETLKSDSLGLLNLYEATHVRYQGEDILKEAYIFTSDHLKNIKPVLDCHLQELVTRALNQPLHWSVPIVEARRYISFYEKQDQHNKLLLNFAKLNFNLVQNLYKQELSEILRWWRDLELCSKLPYIRDVMVMVYFWGMVTNSEPQCSFPRICAAKGLMLYVTMNDSADGYGGITHDDGRKFLKIMNQSCGAEVGIDQLLNSFPGVDQLPNKLQNLYKAIWTSFKEFDHEISRQGRGFAVSNTIKAMGRLVGIYHKKVLWYMGLEKPTFDECILQGFDNSGTHGVAAASIMGMESVTKEACKWLSSAPKIADAAGLFVRISNEYGSYKREHKLNGSGLPTSVDYYMKEHGASEEEAVNKLLELGDEVLMTINREWVCGDYSVPREFWKPAINYARASYLSYMEGVDEFTTPESGLKNDIPNVFIHPIPI